MVKDFPGEIWKEVLFYFDFTNNYRLQVSSFGRLKSFNKLSEGDILKGTTINGYRIVRLKFFKERNEAKAAKLNALQKEVACISAQLKLQLKNGDQKLAKEIEAQLNATKKTLQKRFRKDLKNRTINYHALVHRLVADYFLPKPNPCQTKVAHLDYNKLNNHVSNLKWMTPEENYKHQQSSPYVIKEKEERKLGHRSNPKVAKLTTTKVMLLKKLLNEQKPVKQLIKQFKVSDMQIYRIKRGENWKNIPAAQ